MHCGYVYWFVFYSMYVRSFVFMDIHTTEVCSYPAQYIVHALKYIYIYIMVRLLGHVPKSVSHQVVATLLRQLDFCTLVNRKLLTSPMFWVAHFFPTTCQKIFWWAQFSLAPRGGRSGLVVVLLLVNRWLWPVSQPDATTFPR